MKGKQEVNPVEIRLGSITLFHEPEPELPDLITQARTVAEFMTGVYRHNLFGSDLEPDILHKYERLAAGDIGAAYKQHSTEEVEQEKQRVMMYDEAMMDKLLLPVEQQLMLDFHNARAQMWATDFGEPLDWQDWDRIRRSCKIKQGKATGSLKENRTTRENTSANDKARRVIATALKEVGHVDVEVRALEGAVSQEMFVLGRVATPIHASKPVQLPERVPQWAWNNGLSLLVNGWWLIKTENNLPQLPDNLIAVPSARPMMMADRAFRTPLVWLQTEELPVYTEKKNPGIMLRYLPDGKSSSEEVRKALLTLDPRTSDVWHLLLAKALENGQSQVYQPVEIDVRQFARALGYKPHHKGGMKPRDIDEVARAMEHISSVWITVTPAENTTLEPGTGSGRKGKRLTETTEQRLLAIMERREQRDLFGQARHLIWEVALGKWAHLFPSSYAPVFKSLVDLPARGRDLWAKQIGKELSFWYREDRQVDGDNPEQRRRIKRIRVATLLERACLIHEVQQMREQGNRKRPREYFESALDKLRELNVVDAWEYDADQYKELEKVASKPGAVDVWLQTNVVVTAPAPLIKALPALPKSASKKPARAKIPPPT